MPHLGQRPELRLSPTSQTHPSFCCSTHKTEAGQVYSQRNEQDGKHTHTHPGVGEGETHTGQQEVREPQSSPIAAPQPCPSALMQVPGPTQFNLALSEPRHSLSPTGRQASRIASKQQQAERMGERKRCLQCLVAVETEHVLPVGWDMSLLHVKHLRLVLATDTAEQQLALHLL